MENWKGQKKVLEEKKRAVILSHRSPDGDSIGSSLAMYFYLKNYIEDVVVITPDPAPHFLSWLQGFSEIINHVDDAEKVLEAIEKADLICCLDFNTPTRMGELEKTFSQNKQAYILNIDHHQNPDDFADFQLSDVTASSTAQLVYDFIVELDGVDKISLPVAQSIYTGILTDTGSFRFSSTSKHTHEVVAQLIAIGVSPSEIHQNVYDNYSIDRIKLLGFALNERLKVYPEYKTGIIYLEQKDLEQFNFQKGDTEGLVNYPLSVGMVKMSILITEKDGKVKMSFRSKGNFKVNELAGKYFNGGGHLNAAGGISQLSVLETVQKIEKLLPDYVNEINS